jgi:hypothetical protein
MKVIHDETLLEAPSEFYCPITCAIMRDPLMCRSGQSYERSAILVWIQKHGNTCPLTRMPLSARDLVSNRALQYRINSWLVVNGAIEELGCSESFDNSSSGENCDIVYTCTISDMELATGRSEQSEEAPAPSRVSKGIWAPLKTLRSNSWRRRQGTERTL